MIGSLKADVVVRAEFPSQCSGGRSAILGYFLSSRMKLQLVLVYMHTSISRFL